MELFRHGPVLHAAKTVTRQLLGKDSLFEKALAQSLGVQRFPRLKVWLTRTIIPLGSVVK